MWSIPAENKFKDLMNQMADSPSWTLNSWKKTIDEQMGSWFTYIPGVSQSEEFQQIKRFKSESGLHSIATVADTCCLQAFST